MWFGLDKLIVDLKQISLLAHLTHPSYNYNVCRTSFDMDICIIIQVFLL